MRATVASGGAHSGGAHSGGAHSGGAHRIKKKQCVGQVSLQGIMTMGSVRQSFVGIAGRKAMSHDSALGIDVFDTPAEVRTASVKLPSLSGTSLPHGGGRPVKAQDDKLTVPSLAVNSVACPKRRLDENRER